LIGTERDGFRCVGEPGGSVDDQALWPGEFGGPGVTGCRDGSRVPQKAEVIWEWSQLADSPVSITASASAAADAIVVPLAAGTEFGLACLETGHDEPKLRWSQRILHALASAPVIAGGKVIAVTGPIDGGARQMSAFDLQAGTLLWMVSINGVHAALPSATTDRVFVQESEDTLSGRTLDGRLIWTQNVGRMAHEVDVSGDLLVAAISSPPTLLALDAPTGRRLWSCPLDQPAATAPAVRGNRIYFADPTGVQARSLLDGRRLWHCSGGASGLLYVDRDRFAFLDAAGKLMLGDAATGSQLALISVHQRLVQGQESSDKSPASRVQAWDHPLVAGNAVLWPGPQAILAADLQGRNVREFFPLETDAITAAPLLHAGRIYLGIAGRGLVCLGDRGGP
jgi:outer membrane protein assembly factor BamB